MIAFALVPPSPTPERSLVPTPAPATSARSERTGPAPAAALPEVTAVYQPLVDLHSGDVVGYEALARGPRTSPWTTPAALFERARELGAEDALDWRCRAAAFSGALRAGLTERTALFVNVEPRWLGAPCPPQFAGVLAQAHDRLQVVVEITERALVEDPAALLAAVGEIRAAGWGVALDDVGADPASLALMPFVEPDVIKLDLRLVQDHPTRELSMVTNAVQAQAERTGAVVLAEGIETEEQRRRALALGASLGQGWLFGRPGPLPTRLPPPRAAVGFRRPAPVIAPTPFAAVDGVRGLREATKDLLLPMSHLLEQHALTAGEPPVLLTAFEDERHFTPGTARRYERLAPHCALVGALGAGMGTRPAAGVRGADLPHDDPLAGEWVVTAVGPHFAAALIAKDLGDVGGPDRDRRFAFTTTHDRELVLRSARALLARIAPAGRERLGLLQPG